MKTTNFCLALLALALLGGCASGVQRESSPGTVAGQAAARLPVGAMAIALAPEAKKLVAENPKFSEQQLLAVVRRAVEAKGLAATDTGAARADIVVTEFRVRGTAAAVLFGAFAGSDNVTGDVIVRDRSGAQLRKFRINASYALGGAAGGDDMRLGWLYDRFAELVVEELSGQRRD